MYKLKEEKKSSKEILSELFDSFNATPPSSPPIHAVDDEDGGILGPNIKIEPPASIKLELKKEKDSKKKHKKDKKKKKKKEKKSKKKKKESKKKKKRKRRSSSSSSDSSTSSDSDSDVDKFVKKKVKKEKSESDCDKIDKVKFNELLSKVKSEKSDRKVVLSDDVTPGSSKNIIISVPVKPEEKKDIPRVLDEESLISDLNSVILPDVVPSIHCKPEPEEISKADQVEEAGPQVAEIFQQELLESSIAYKPNPAAEKPKANIKITNLKKINILELAEQKKAEELKEKAEKYEEGEITSDSSQDEAESALPTLRPVESDNEQSVVSKEKKEKVKKCSRRKSHKSSLRKKSRSRSRKRSHSRDRDRIHSKRSRSRSRDKRSTSRSRKRKHSSSWRSPLRRSASIEVKRERRVYLDRTSHHSSRKDRLSSKRDEDKRKDKIRDKDKDKVRDKDKDKERKRNKSKSPIQLPSMMVQDNPKKPRRSRSRERNRGGLEIDKKKLLEIARKNALSMLKQQGSTLTTVTDTAKVATTITAGGKTVDELTDFCKALSQKEGRDEIELSPISDSSDEENEKAFHHPFLLKDRPNNIVMNIRNCTALPVKTHQEKTAEAAQQLRLQFPVSSGTHHRKTENEWVPVEPKKDEPVPVPPPKQTKGGHPRIEAPKVDPLPLEPPPLPPQDLSVFPNVEDQLNVNIGDLVGQKLAAMKRLQDNPCDFSAMHLLRNAEDKLNKWNEVNQLSQPGLFTGSTGARLLTPAELASGQQAWAKKDQLMCAQPVTEGIGKSLLQKMGWKPGEGLGKNHEGTLEPLSLPLKMDKRGLVCAEEVKRPPRQFINNNHQRNQKKPTVKSLEGKHPVSLLLEYCSKRHFNPPVFNLIDESGPSHKKMFLFRVEVNGMAYQAPCGSNNKKQAKSEAAMVCLRALGLMPCTSVPSPAVLLQSVNQ